METMPAVRQRFIKRPQGQTRMVWSYTCSRTADWSPLVPGALPRGFKSFAARPQYGNSQKDFYLSPSGRRYNNLRDAWNSVSVNRFDQSYKCNNWQVRRILYWCLPWSLSQSLTHSQAKFQMFCYQNKRENVLVSSVLGGNTTARYSLLLILTVHFVINTCLAYNNPSLFWN